MSDGGMGRRSVGERRTRRLGIGISSVLVVAAVVLAFVGAGGSGNSQAIDTSPHFVDVTELTELEDSLDTPIYWAGKRASKALELTQELGGSIYLRYVPEGIAPGESPAAYLTVGTYPVEDAQAALRRAAVAAGVGVGRAAAGAITLANPKSEGSVYLAFPDSDLQLEIYDPVPGRAMELIRSGAIVPVGDG